MNEEDCKFDKIHLVYQKIEKHQIQSMLETIYNTIYFSTFPYLIFEKENIDFNFFIDMANVWEVDYNNSLDSNKIRSSTGIAINWFSGIGPLSFSYAIPLSEADSDITEKFRFQIGTSF